MKNQSLEEMLGEDLETEDLSLEGIEGFRDGDETEEISEVDALEEDEDLDEVEDVEELEDLEELEGLEDADDTDGFEDLTRGETDETLELVVEEYAPDHSDSMQADSRKPQETKEEEVDPRLVFDWDEALDTFMGNEEVVRKVLAVQVEKVAGQIPKIEQAISEGNWEQLREEAHSIKGGSWNLQAKELGDKAFVLEMAGRDCDASAAEEGYAPLVAAYQRFSQRAGEILGPS